MDELRSLVVVLGDPLKHETFAPALAAAQARIADAQPAACARTGNALGGAVASRAASARPRTSTGHQQDPFIVAEAVNNATTASPQLTVLYDGACPLCRREIGIYRGLPPLRSDAPVCFADVSDAALPLPSALPPGTTREQLLARFHVRGRDGALLSGAQAFLALWAALPGWRWLALAGRVPGVAWLMEQTYRLFLRWRPMLQHWAFRLDAPGLSRTKSQDSDLR